MVYNYNMKVTISWYQTAWALRGHVCNGLFVFLQNLRQGDVTAFTGNVKHQHWARWDPWKKCEEWKGALLVYILGKCINGLLRTDRYLLYIHCWQMKPLTYTNVFFPHRWNPSGKHCFSWQITTDYFSFMRYAVSHNKFHIVVSSG